MRRDAQRLQDIVVAADAVAAYLRQIGRDEFLTGGIAHDAILRQLTVAGEAAYKVSRGMGARHTEMPWGQIATWQFATVQLPLLRDQAIAIIAVEFPEEADGPQN